MNLPSFRLLVNLSNYFDDVQRLCRIFINGTKVHKIIHIKEHISQVLNIKEPFHLLANDNEFLPPMEDIRILNTNETIVVVPGSRIINEISSFSSLSVSDTDIYKNFRGIRTYNKQSQTNTKIPIETESDECNAVDSNNTLNNKESAAKHAFVTFPEFHAFTDKTETYPKVTYPNRDLTKKFDCDVSKSVMPVKKRRRVRKKKTKPELIVSSIHDVIDESKPKKPKIIDSVTIPSSKHIHFDNIEANKNGISQEIMQSAFISEQNKISPSGGLSALLALGQSSTPITFRNTKIQSASQTKPNKEVRNVTLNNGTQNYESLTHMDPKEIPILDRKPQVNDKIAFQVLKIADNYTPQISNFIIAEVISYCAQSEDYTVRILEGLDEIQVPYGKFSISEENKINDIVTFNSAEIREPRLIS